MEIATDCGAHAIKMQTYQPETMTIRSDNPDFYISHGLWKGRSLYDLYEVAQTPFEWQEELFSHLRLMISRFFQLLSMKKRSSSSQNRVSSV